MFTFDPVKMAGAGKRRNKTERQDQAASQHLSEPRHRPELTSIDKSQAIGGLDGPSDDRSISSRPPHVFGPSLGYDPARSNVDSRPNVPNRLELPAEAYKDSHGVSLFHPKLSALYSI